MCGLSVMLKLVFLLTLRSLWLVNVTCIQLFLAVVNFHANMCWGFISWTVNIATLPIRALGALHREKMMQSFLQEMERELESLSWKNGKLEARLKMTVKERQLMESMLAEIEEEHDVAIGKIERLEKEVQYLLKEAKLRLRESQTKGLWDSSSKIKSSDEPITGTFRGYQNNLGNSEKQIRLKNPTGLVDPLTPLVFSNSIEPDLALDQRREIALSQSLFSAFLSLLVGVVIWEAKDPCMPLVMALFAVLCLSLRSVVQFFSTLKNRPASDAVALLSFNWFILGTLTYPTLPKVTPIFIAFLGAGLKRIGVVS